MCFDARFFGSSTGCVSAFSSLFSGFRGDVHKSVSKAAETPLIFVVLLRRPINVSVVLTGVREKQKKKTGVSRDGVALNFVVVFPLFFSVWRPTSTREPYSGLFVLKNKTRRPKQDDGGIGHCLLG